MIGCSLRHLVVLLAVGLFATRLDAQEPIAPQPVTIEGAAAHVYKSIDGIDLRLHVQTLLEADRFLTKLGYLPLPSLNDTQPLTTR